MIKASAFIRTDTLMLLASAITLVTFVYLNSGNELDSASIDDHIRPIGKLVVVHNPANASNVLQQLASLNAINPDNNKQHLVEHQTETGSSALTSAVTNADNTATTPAVTAQPIITPVSVAKNTAAQPSTNHHPYYNTPSPRPVYQMPPPINPYRYQYGYAPYPHNR